MRDATGGQRTVPVLIEDGKVNADRLAGARLRGSDRGHGGDDQRAARVRVRGVVQGVGFRPFVFRLARRIARRMGAERAEWRGYSSGRRRARARCLSARSCNASLRRPRGSPRSRSMPPEPAGLQDFTIRESQPQRPALGAHLARSAGVRRLPRRVVRSGRPALSAIPISTAPTAVRATP